jgi:hypothetical protein
LVMTIPFILIWRLKIWIVMTIFQILQVFHASLCPLGHGRYITKSKPNKHKHEQQGR